MTVLTCACSARAGPSYMARTAGWAHGQPRPAQCFPVPRRRRPRRRRSARAAGTCRDLDLFGANSAQCSPCLHLLVLTTSCFAQLAVRRARGGAERRKVAWHNLGGGPARLGREHEEERWCALVHGCFCCCLRVEYVRSWHTEGDQAHGCGTTGARQPHTAKHQAHMLEGMVRCVTTPPFGFRRAVSLPHSRAVLVGCDEHQAVVGRGWLRAQRAPPCLLRRCIGAHVRACGRTVGPGAVSQRLAARQTAAPRAWCTRQEGLRRASRDGAAATVLPLRLPRGSLRSAQRPHAGARAGELAVCR